ncbi:phage shock protein C (PspC) family protein [Larkinella arboricola]|uniref:Phage shock protein C (PspC) family protein n=1 Tax=Larkinella arboricola TaxID=643671 RepID=A0A327X603_LARAB|nr:PspC domain-containing protein [Larkinella arboricola]RAK02365.1 phage shock protein C (PspC) family protein [Larkinella arboricola]
MTAKQLHQIPSEAMLGGVSAGLADYFGIDKVFVRLFFVLMLILPTSVPIVIIYIVLWIAMPKGERYFQAHPDQRHH